MAEARDETKQSVGIAGALAIHSMPWTLTLKHAIQGGDHER